MAEGNSAVGKVSSPDHINVSSKKVFGGARKSATRNACAMYLYISALILYCLASCPLIYSLISRLLCFF